MNGFDFLCWQQEPVLRAINYLSFKELYFYVLVVSLFILALLRSRFAYFFYRWTRSATNYNLSKLYFTEIGQRFNIADFLMTFFRWLIFGTALTVLAAQSAYAEHSPLLLFASCLSLVIALWLAWWMIHRLIGILLEEAAHIRFYIYTVSIIQFNFCILLIPALLYLAFKADMHSIWIPWALLALYLCYLVFLYIRGFRLSKEYFRSKELYIFIYLCTLEIAPAILVYKLIADWYGG